MSAGYHPYAAEEEQAEAELVALLMALVRLPTAALLAQLAPAEAEACVGPLLAALTVHRGAAVPLQLVFPPGRTLPRRVRAFADALAEAIRGTG